MPAHRRTVDYRSAQRFARTLRLKSRDDWRHWVEDPSNRDLLNTLGVPSRPDVTYRDRGWSGWKRWLGVTTTLRPFLSFAEWSQFVQARGIRTTKQYALWCQEHKDECKRLGVPVTPSYVYGFEGWRQLLEKPYAPGNVVREYAPFDRARRWARSLKLVKVAAWRAYAKEHRDELAAHGCPVSPDRVVQYRQQWFGWKDFLGDDTRPTRNYKRNQ